MFKLIIATSASFTDYDLFRSKLDHLLQNQQEVELCAGFSKAGDALAARYAAERPVSIRVFDPGFRGMYRALVYAEAALFFYDGVSAGITKYIEEARHCRLKVKVVTFQPTRGTANHRIPTNELDIAIPTGKPRKRTASTESKAKKPSTPIDPSWKQVYQQAHERWFAKEYPATYKDSHYCEPNYPDPKTTNGITAIIINHLKHEGHYSNRQNVMGRQIGGITVTESGQKFDDRKWIKSSTHKGASDIIATIRGKTICIEVKNANTRDTIKPAQVKERKRIEAAGGVYIIITSVSEFFVWYERYMANNYSQQDIFPV